jgi:hypothetical protein
VGKPTFGRPLTFVCRPLPFLALAVCVLSAPRSARAEDALPFPLQAALFKRIFNYDKTLAKSGIHLLLVHAGDGADSASELQKAFHETGIESTISVSKTLEKDLEKDQAGTTVVYLLPGVASSTIRDLCTKKAILIISGLVSNAESGQVGIAVGKKEDGHPGIVVNLVQLKAEGQEVSSDLLRLARVIQ